FIGPLLTIFNRNRFEVACYSNVLAPDGVTARLHSKGLPWRDIARLTDEQVDAQIRHDQIDLLVDLAGHTARNRIGVLARKPAPIQITYLGYPNTTGLKSVDYRITDNYADPAGLTHSFYTEKLIRLPNCFLCSVI